MKRLLSCCLGLPLLVASCGDPFDRPGTWRPEGVNEANLRAMVADPQDLTRGVDQPEQQGQLPTAAIVRLRTNKLKELPDSGVAKVGPAGSGGSGGSASGGSGSGGS